MPLYEYDCADCRAPFEALRPMSQVDAAIACPRCEGINTRRRMSTCAALSRDGNGSSQMVAGSGGGCGSCGGGHCATCGH